MGRHILSSVVLLLLSAICFAANDPQPWELEHFKASASNLYQAAAAVPAAPGVDVVVLREEQTSVFEADGRSTSTYYLVFKVLTQRGAEDWADVSLGWEPWHEEHPSINARVITPDQVEHVLDVKTIEDAPARAQDKIYSDRRMLRAPLPAMAPGAVIEEEFVNKESAPLFGAGTVDEFYIGRRVPVRQAHLVLDAPASLALQYKLEALPDLKPRSTPCTVRADDCEGRGGLPPVPGDRRRR